MSAGGFATGLVQDLPLKQENRIIPDSMRLYFFGLVVLLAALTLFGGNIARLGIPVITTGAAYVFYRKAPVLYVSFVWWLFFVICLLRRVIDYRSGFSDQSIILAAPFLAALVSLPTMFTRVDIWKLRTSLPFALALACTVYGAAVGFLCLPKKALLVASLAWFSPLVIGFFMFSELTSSERRDAHIDGLRKTFCWGTFLMGLYGIYQFVVAPKWDALWMTETGMGSIGSPEPYGLRVFSTMNGPGTLAYTLLVGLLLLLLRRTTFSMIAGGIGFVTMLLSSVRAAWGALALALVLFAMREKKHIGKLIVTTVCLVTCAIIAMSLPPLRENVQDRLMTFTDLQGDTSYQERTGGYREMIAYVVDTPLGTGLGTMDAMFQDKTSLGTRDSGIWEIILSLGWVAGLVYFVALGILAWNAWSANFAQSQVEVIAGSIAIGLLGQIPMGSVVGITGIAIWMFAAIAMAPFANAAFPERDQREWHRKAPVA